MDETVTPLEAKSSGVGIVVGIFLVLILLGVGAGYFLSKNKTTSSTKSATSSDMVATKNEVGSTDTRTFRDSATGTLEAGGLSGEGTHKLTRDGGPSQTVYLISSVVDLNEFVGKKVEVWGETIKANKVPWLMDVGRVKLVE